MSIGVNLWQKMVFLLLFKICGGYFLGVIGRGVYYAAGRYNAVQ
jgi:hypothetical protein